MSKFVKSFVATVAALALLTVFAVAEEKQEPKKEKAKPKHTIKEAMKKGFKGKDALRGKVLSGKATDKEKLALLDMFVSLVESKPPKGDDASWQKLAGTSALAAAKVAVGREGAIDELKKATNCKACHDAHKGK